MRPFVRYDQMTDTLHVNVWPCMAVVVFLGFFAALAGRFWS